jgi:DNA-binding transcriptional ArsR family regulator
LCDPFDVTLTFSTGEITASVVELTHADRAQESTLNSKDRVVAALEDGPAYPDELVEATGLTRGTVKNTITALKKARRVEITGEVRAQMEQVRLVAPAARPIKKSAADATPDTSTVAGFFASPPDWLPRQIKLYRGDPDRHIKALCGAVAAVVLGDAARHAEVRAQVEEELAKG